MSTPPSDVTSRLRRVFLDCLSEPPSPDALEPDTAIVDRGLALDSIALLELVIGIENEFDILLDEGSLAPEHFTSFGKLARWVEDQLERSSDAGARDPA